MALTSWVNSFSTNSKNIFLKIKAPTFKFTTSIEAKNIGITYNKIGIIKLRPSTPTLNITMATDQITQILQD